MTSEQIRYNPTLWRTCRVLMNERRLQCLAIVIKRDRLSVKEIAEESGLPENQTSINLRALQARGLIRSYRDRVNIRYVAEPNLQVEHAATILKEMRRALIKSYSPEECIRLLRAFTHARRLSILRLLLQYKEIPFEKIEAITSYSQPAISRHVTVLYSAGVVELSKNDGLKLVASRKQPKLVRTLLKCVMD